MNKESIKQQQQNQKIRVQNGHEVHIQWLISSAVFQLLLILVFNFIYNWRKLCQNVWNMVYAFKIKATEAKLEMVRNDNNSNYFYP